MWIEALASVMCIASGALGYRAASARKRSRVFWALLCAALIFPLALLYQLPPSTQAKSGRYAVQISMAAGWFLLLTGISHAIFPRTIPVASFATIERTMANLVSPNGPIPTQCLNGDLSAALLLAAIGLSISLFCLNRPVFAALVLSAVGFVLGIAVEAADRMLQVARFDGHAIPELPRGPFALAVLTLLAAAVATGWISRWRPAA